MDANVLERCALAEGRDVGVIASFRLAAPSVICAGHTGDVLAGELAMGAIHHNTELAGVDEEHLSAPVAEPAVLSVPRQELEAGGDLRRIEKLAGQRDHAVDEVR